MFCCKKSIVVLLQEIDRDVFASAPVLGLTDVDGELAAGAIAAAQVDLNLFRRGTGSRVGSDVDDNFGSRAVLAVRAA